MTPLISAETQKCIANILAYNIEPLNALNDLFIEAELVSAPGTPSSGRVRALKFTENLLKNVQWENPDDAAKVFGITKIALEKRHNKYGPDAFDLHEFQALEKALGRDGYRIDSALNIVAAQDPESTKAWYGALQTIESTALNIVLNLETDKENLTPRQEIPRAKSLVRQATRLLLAGVSDGAKSTAVASFEGLSRSALAAIPDSNRPRKQEPAPDDYHTQAGSLKAWDDAARQLNPLAVLPPSEWRRQPSRRH